MMSISRIGSFVLILSALAACGGEASVGDRSADRSQTDALEFAAAAQVYLDRIGDPSRTALNIAEKQLQTCWKRYQGEKRSVREMIRLGRFDYAQLILPVILYEAHDLLSRRLNRIYASAPELRRIAHNARYLTSQAKTLSQRPLNYCLLLRSWQRRGWEVGYVPRWWIEQYATAGLDRREIREITLALYSDAARLAKFKLNRAQRSAIGQATALPFLI
jgi:hypothetical protein